MCEDQGHVCQTCKESASYNLYVDHDHETNKVRGFLCARCNTIAGVLEDERIRNVIEYLRDHKSNALARLELLIREKQNGTN